MIATSMFCIFDVSEADRPNIYFELGFAHGIKKPHFLICNEASRLPSDLAGYEYIAYRSNKDLREKLITSIPKFVNIAINLIPKTFVGHNDLIRAIFTRLLNSKASPEELVSAAQAAGFTKNDLQTTLGHFTRMGAVKKDDDCYVVSPEGREFATQVLMQMGGTG